MELDWRSHPSGLLGETLSTTGSSSRSFILPSTSVDPHPTTLTDHSRGRSSYTQGPSAMSSDLLRPSTPPGMPPASAGREQSRLSFGVVCSSNINRSMEAHVVLSNAGETEGRRKARWQAAWQRDARETFELSSRKNKPSLSHAKSKY